jgi:hypothetical protein
MVGTGRAGKALRPDNSAFLRRGRTIDWVRAHGINAERKLDNGVMDIIEYNIRLVSTQYMVS